MPTPPPPKFDRATHCHELNTSLTVIQARAQLLLRRVERRRLSDGDTDWLADGLSAIVSATGVLGSVIDGLCAIPPESSQAAQHGDGREQSARHTEGTGR